MTQFPLTGYRNCLALVTVSCVFFTSSLSAFPIQESIRVNENLPTIATASSPQMKPTEKTNTRSETEIYPQGDHEAKFRDGFDVMATPNDGISVAPTTSDQQPRHSIFGCSGSKAMPIGDKPGTARPSTAAADAQCDHGLLVPGPALITVEKALLDKLVGGVLGSFLFLTLAVLVLYNAIFLLGGKRKGDKANPCLQPGYPDQATRRHELGTAESSCDFSAEVQTESAHPERFQSTQTPQHIVSSSRQINPPCPELRNQDCLPFVNTIDDVTHQHCQLQDTTQIQDVLLECQDVNETVLSSLPSEHIISNDEVRSDDSDEDKHSWAEADQLSSRGDADSNPEGWIVE